MVRNEKDSLSFLNSDEEYVDSVLTKYQDPIDIFKFLCSNGHVSTHVILLMQKWLAAQSDGLDKDTILHTKKLYHEYLKLNFEGKIDDADISPSKVLELTINMKNAVKRGSNIYYVLLASESFSYISDMSSNELVTLPDNEYLCEIMSELEEYVETTTIDFNNFENSLAHSLSYLSLSGYLNDISSTENTPEITVKLFHYADLYAKSSLRIMHDNGVRDLEMEYTISCCMYATKISHILALDSIEKHDKAWLLNEFDNIIQECNMELKILQNSKPTTQTQKLYILINRNIFGAFVCKFYVIFYLVDMGLDMDADVCGYIMSEFDKCRKAARRILKLHDIKDEDSLYQAIDVCYYMSILNLYELEDVKYFYKIASQIRVSNKYITSSMKSKAHIHYYICSNCKNILEQFGRNKKIYNLGHEFAKGLKEYTNVAVNEQEEETIREICAYFKSASQPIKLFKLKYFSI